jgi:hypothetical protein
MALPNRFDVVVELGQRFPELLRDHENDDLRRTFTMRVAQTLAARFPSENWGTKRSSSTAPLSADVVCTREPFEGADLLKGTVSGLGQLQWAETGPLGGQVFVTVAPQDWGVVAPPTPPAPPSPPDPVLAAIAALTARVDALGEAVRAIPAPPAPAPPPRYVGRIFGFSVTLTPEP